MSTDRQPDTLTAQQKAFTEAFWRGFNLAGANRRAALDFAIRAGSNQDTNEAIISRAAAFERFLSGVPGASLEDGDQHA